jgi:hypothetical protein
MRHPRTALQKAQEAVAPNAGADAPLSERLPLGRPRVDSCRAPPPCVRPRSLTLALVVAGLLSACGGASGQSGTATSVDSNVTPAPPAPTAPTQAPTGHYVGAVTVAEVTYFGDAVFTRDGAVRLYVGGPYDNGGELQLTRPESSEQFVGTIEMRDTQWSGSGLIIGQECAINAAGRFCGQPAPAEISATAQLNTDGSGSSVLRGEIRVTTSSGTETWPLSLQLWGSGDPTLARSAMAAGQYKEVLAEFASAGDVIMHIDSSGKLFFQSANSGCVGNGALVPHLDGAADTYDVTLMMENCNGAYAYLNGPYDGIGLFTASSYWDYDSQLRMWLSKPTEETPLAALTTLGEPL